jgi:imidazolonepropionase-like amidohydrolase
VAAQARDGFLPEAIRKKALEVGPQILQTLSRSHKAGIRIAFGTDSGVSRHGENAKEFALMVEAGMSPMAAIAAATCDAAEHIGCADQIGTIEPGKFADIIAVAHDPLKDIRALCEVSWVMKSGIVYKPIHGQRPA